VIPVETGLFHAIECHPGNGNEYEAFGGVILPGSLDGERFGDDGFDCGFGGTVRSVTAVEVVGYK